MSMANWPLGQLFGCLEVHAHEEQAGAVVVLHVTELLRVDDVAAGLIQQPCDGVHDAFGIDT
jgi:hypothetical protein